VTFIDPVTVDADLRDDITDEELFRQKDYGGKEAIVKSDDIASSGAYAVSEPSHINVNEMVIEATYKA